MIPDVGRMSEDLTVLLYPSRLFCPLLEGGGKSSVSSGSI